MKRARKDVGDTLIEVLLTIVIMSATVTALVSSLGTVANAGTAQRTSVLADVAIRNYAEAAKVAVQSCVAGANFVVAYDHPAGYVVTSDSNACPVAPDQPRQLKLTVTGPSGYRKTMALKVRTP